MQQPGDSDKDGRSLPGVFNTLPSTLRREEQQVSEFETDVRLLGTTASVLSVSGAAVEQPTVLTYACFLYSVIVCILL